MSKRTLSKSGKNQIIAERTPVIGRQFMDRDGEQDFIGLSSGDRHKAGLRRKSMRINREKAAALCIDYQERLLPVIYDNETLIERSVRLLKGLRVLNVPVYLTQQYTKGLGPTVAPILEVAEPRASLEKLAFSAYPCLKDVLLPPEEMRDIIICGIESHICVLQTAIDLKSHGYQPYLAADCISSRRRQDYELALKRARQEGILITSYEAVLFELLGEAGTPESKAIQKIVR